MSLGYIRYVPGTYIYVPGPYQICPWAIWDMSLGYKICPWDNSWVILGYITCVPGLHDTLYQDWVSGLILSDPRSWMKGQGSNKGEDFSPSFPTLLDLVSPSPNLVSHSTLAPLSLLIPALTLLLPPLNLVWALFHACISITVVVHIFIWPLCVYPTQLSALFKFALTCFMVLSCATSFS